MHKKKQRYQYYVVLLLLFTCIINGILLDWVKHYIGNRKEENIEQMIAAKMCYFPIPASKDEKMKAVIYADSWRESRSYGGDRVHEGCDIMAPVNQRGIYPVLSVSEGTIENMGWLKLGGYRIGIRSGTNVYFYYAHLSDYMPGLSVGQQVKAGECIGFMGDTGYSEVEGTTGNFPVHLHFGIYMKTVNGGEEAQNPYPFLLQTESKKLCYDYTL